ncbi:F-box/WD repeat-containing protein 5 isoform X2 [Hemitrygon akajei]|uniref:F-box/WD repeat-containing protein 5 isoform X2 n=1 Tax=Hemitrygon akajei TaxID=2704970 RepID=UPI003BF9FCD4
MENGVYPLLPDTILLEVFQNLEHQNVLAAGSTCRQWYGVSRDDFLWRDLFYRYYNVNRSIPRHPAATSWLGEFRRLYDTIPCVQVATLKEHRDQVLHVSFSHNGYLFGSCSKDCFVKDIESENINVVKRLFQLQNRNASTIRTVMVADCSRHNSPDLLLGFEEQGLSSSPRVFYLGSDSEDECYNKPKYSNESASELEAGVQDSAEIEANMDTLGLQPLLDEKQLEARVADLFLQAKTKSTDMDILSECQETQNKKYLIFTTGSLTYTPHQIGIKQILPHHMTTTGPVLGEERSSSEFFDPLDHTIDVHGHIIGMGLSPDHRYLYVNSRAWPKGCVISDPMNPPPIAEEIDIHVFDLKTMQEVTQTLRAHTAYTPNDECFFIFLDVSRDYVASGAEDRHGYIWDRHYNICLAKLQHEDVVNSVAFSPVDQEMLITASDDCTLKVWRSPRIMRIISTKPTHKKFSFFWLNKK